MLHLYLACIVFSLCAGMLLEVLAPLHADAPVRLGRWLRNLLLSVLALGVTIGCSVAFWPIAREAGFTPVAGGLNASALPIGVQWVLTFLLLDGVAYGIHRLSHGVSWLWGLHAVHHSDIELDATSTHRHHPAENLFTAAVTLPLLLLLAPPAWAVLTYTLAAVVVSTLSHANLALPDWLDKFLRHVVVTPAYHRTHHSAHQPQTDSNYATLLPLFDVLFRTSSPATPDRGHSLEIGLETGRDAGSQTLTALLRAPFRPRTPPWPTSPEPRDT